MYLVVNVAFVGGSDDELRVVFVFFEKVFDLFLRVKVFGDERMTVIRAAPLDVFAGSLFKVVLDGGGSRVDGQTLFAIKVTGTLHLPVQILSLVPNERRVDDLLRIFRHYLLLPLVMRRLVHVQGGFHRNARHVVSSLQAS